DTLVRLVFSSAPPAQPTAAPPLSLHDALPIFLGPLQGRDPGQLGERRFRSRVGSCPLAGSQDVAGSDHRDRGAGRRGGEKRMERSEEHTSELQSRENLVCRLLLEKKKNHARVL